MIIHIDLNNMIVFFRRVTCSKIDSADERCYGNLTIVQAVKKCTAFIVILVIIISILKFNKMRNENITSKFVVF